MIRVLSALAVGCALSVAGVAATCNQSTWTFDAVAACGSGSNGVAFTQNGETITILPEALLNGVVQPSGGSPVNGLFEVQQGNQGNLASGIGPFMSDQGGSPYTSQKGIQDGNIGNTNVHYDVTIYIEVSQTGSNPVPSGSTLSFLMQEGDVPDSFTVYTDTAAAGTAPPNFANMTQFDSTPISVGAEDGGATTPQFKITTDTSTADPIEYIAIKADCTYLLLNSITSSGPTSVPEPRFYGLLLGSLLCAAGMVYQKRRAARLDA
jgi:hypothetical protein